MTLYYGNEAYHMCLINSFLGGNTMADSRCSCGGQGNGGSVGNRETVCIDTMRVLDSCRDKDCYEDVRVYLTPAGQDAIDHTATVRTVDAKIIATSIVVDDVPFNRGFYQINIRFYIRLKFEACIAPGHIQRCKGLVVLDKSVVLYGGEGCVRIFRSSEENGFCSCSCGDEGTTNKPIAVVEAVEPVVLDTHVAGPDCSCGCQPDPCGCGCGCAHACGCCGREGSLPREVAACFDEGFAAITDECRRLLVSIGLFTVIRLERPGQYLISATEYAVPEKECRPAGNEESPCDIFRAMPFPGGEFYPPALKETARGCK